MNPIIIVALIVVGLLLVALEIVALPGGIAGILGFIIAAVGVWQTYAHYGLTAGNIALISSIIILIGLLVYFLKARTWRKFSLNDEIDSKVNSNVNIQVGDKGITLSRLAPTGNAMFGTQMVEVHSQKEFIEVQQPVEVVSVSDNHFVVRLDSTAADEKIKPTS